VGITKATISRRGLLKSSKAHGALTLEAEETLDAIRRGQIDALIVEEADSAKVYVLRSFDEVSRSELELRTAGKERRRTNAQLQRLLDDRERLFQDLHDGCIQSIYAVGLTLEAAMTLNKTQPNEAEVMLGESIASLNLVIQELRSFLTGHDLQARSEGNLRSGIEHAVRIAGNRGLVFGLDINEAAMHSLTERESLQLLQIARECISNASRHSGAKTGRVTLKKRNGRLHFEVSDDGRGFEVGSGNQSGFGLHHIHARARRIGGNAQVISQLGKGTRVVVECGPLPKRRQT